MKTKLILLVTFLSLACTAHDVLGQTTLILQPDAVDGKDAHINSHFPDTNYETNGGVYSSAWTWSGSFGIVRSFLQFDLSSIPPNINITSAKLSLYNDPGNNLVLTDGEHASLTASNASYISQLTEAWEESSITWNNQPSYDTTHQVILLESISPDQDYIAIDVLDMVRNMVDKPNENHGFVLRLQNEINYAALIFASSDNDDSTKHPKLEIVYDNPLAIEEQTPNDLQISAYPNPVQNTLTISQAQIPTTVTYTLYNILGKAVAKGDFHTTNHTLDMATFAKGVYFVHLDNGEIRQTLRVVKE